MASSGAPTTKAFFAITRLGVESVMLFFVLSGFLVGGIYIEKSLNGRFEPRQYGIDRLTRIYTPYIPALIFAAACSIWRGDAPPASEFLANLFSLQGIIAPPYGGNVSLWSLSYEVWFYIGLAAILLPTWRRSLTTMAISLTTSAACIVVFTKLDATYLAVWLIGAIAYFIRGRRYLLVKGVAGLLISVAGIVLMQLTSVSAQVDVSEFRGIDRSYAVLIAGLGFGLVCAAASGINLTRPALPHLAQLLSSFSYSLYLFHIPVIIALKESGLLFKHDTLNLASLSAFASNITIILLSSYAAYWCFERHTQTIRNWLSRRRSSGTSPAGANTDAR